MFVLCQVLRARWCSADGTVAPVRPPAHSPQRKALPTPGPPHLGGSACFPVLAGCGQGAGQWGLLGRPAEVILGKHWYVAFCRNLGLLILLSPLVFAVFLGKNLNGELFN